VTEGAIRLDQLLDASGLADLIFLGELEVDGPSNWLIRDTERCKDLVVEVFSAEQNLVDAA
jgi:hypothetical protein